MFDSKDQSPSALKNAYLTLGYVRRARRSRRTNNRSLQLESSFYRLSSSLRKSSFDLPSFCWSRPSNSSSFPSANVRSSSLNCAYFCFSLPFTSFQPPLNSSFVIVIESSHAERRSVVLRDINRCTCAAIPARNLFRETKKGTP